MNSCPSCEQIQRLLDERLSDPEREAIETHIEACVACQGTLARLGADAAGLDWRVLRRSRPAAAECDADLARGLEQNPPAQAASPSMTEDEPPLIVFPGAPTDKGPLGQLDSFAIRKELSRGRFGVVYQAYDELDRLVAIKVLKPELAASIAERARFEREARKAAAVKHDHIVTIHQVGHTPGFPLPYLVMEYVDGETLSERLRRDGVLKPREAAGIVQQVAWGLAAAHAGGLVHRDIKPSNILLESASGRAKLTDFGLARVLEGGSVRSSHSGGIVGTPAYMSPEQIVAPDRLDSRTDLYGLGVVLYELLTGERPFRGVTQMVLQQQVHEEPRRPRKLNDTIPRDLETITLKCLAKEAGRRYQTAGELADDLRRFLAGQPIQARPIHAWERTVKWARRRPAVTALLALVLFVTALGFGLVEQARRQAEADKVEIAKQKDLAQANEKAANEREAEAKAVLEFFANRVFAAARPEGQEGGLGHDVSLRRAVEASLPFVQKSFTNQPLIEARLRLTLGRSFGYLGDAKTAAEQHDAARALYAQHRGPDHPDTLRSMMDLTNSYTDLGRHADALKLNQETLALTKAKFGPDHPNTLQVMNNLAINYDDHGRHADALKLNQETLALMKAKLGLDHPDTLNSMHSLANSYYLLGRHADALTLREETLALTKAKLGPDHPHTLMSMHSLADSYLALGRHADALKLHQETLALSKAKLGADHRETLLTMDNLADCYTALGRHADALTLREETLALMKAKLGLDHPETLLSMRGLAGSLVELDRGAEAVPVMDDCVQRAAGKVVDPRLFPEVMDLRLRHFEKTKDAAGCRQTAEMWEKLNRADAASLYTAACMRAVTAAVIRGTDLKSVLRAKQADAEGDRAMAWLKQSVAAGYKDAAHMAKDKDLDVLRDRQDFKALVAELQASPAKPK